MTENRKKRADMKRIIRESLFEEAMKEKIVIYSGVFMRHAARILESGTRVFKRGANGA